MTPSDRYALAAVVLAALLTFATRLAPFVTEMIKSFNFTGDQDSEVASAAVNAEMAAQMMAGMPLRALRSFGSFSAEQLSGLISQLNGLLAQ